MNLSERRLRRARGISASSLKGGLGRVHTPLMRPREQKAIAREGERGKEHVLFSSPKKVHYFSAGRVSRNLILIHCQILDLN